MQHRNLVASTSMIVAAALTVTACGGDSGDSSGGKIKGAQEDPKPSSSSTSGEAGARPNTDPPGDMKVNFTWPKKTGMKSLDSAIKDSQEYFRALERVSANHNLKDPAASYYAREDGLKYLQTQAKYNIEGKTAPTGVVEYYKPRPTLSGKDKVSLRTCSDQSEIFSKHVKSSKVDRTDPGPDDFVLYELKLEKSHKTDAWQVVKTYVTERAVKECKR